MLLSVALMAQDRWLDHRERRRAELVDAAVEAIRRRGPQVSVGEIAAVAGVSKPILYRHFADKGQLWEAVGRRMADQLVAEISGEIEREREPRAYVAALVDVYLRGIEREPEVYRFVMHQGFAERAPHGDPVADYRNLVAAHLTRVIGDRLREVGMDSGPAEAWAWAVCGAVQSAGDWWMERRTLSRETLTAYLTNLLWSGFGGMLVAAMSGDDAAVLRLVDTAD